MKNLSSFIVAGFFCLSTLPALAGATEGDHHDSHKHKKHMPPQAAIEACKGLTENTTCQFNGRDSQLVSGICVTKGHHDKEQVLACRPERNNRDLPPANNEPTAK